MGAIYQIGGIGGLGASSVILTAFFNPLNVMWHFSVYLEPHPFGAQLHSVKVDLLLSCQSA